MKAITLCGFMLLIMASSNSLLQAMTTTTTQEEQKSNANALLKEGIDEDNPKLIQQAMAHGADINTILTLPEVPAAQQHKITSGTPLVYALVTEKPLKIITQLVSYNPSLYDNAFSENTVFSLAPIVARYALFVNPEIINIITSKGFDFNDARSFYNNQTTLSGIIHNIRFIPLTDEFASLFKDLKQQNPAKLPIASWLQQRMLDVLLNLIAAGSDVNKKAPDGETPLMYAALYDDANSIYVKALLYFGANPNTKNMNGKTALEIAQNNASTDNKQIIALLQHPEKLNQYLSQQERNLFEAARRKLLAKKQEEMGAKPAIFKPYKKKANTDVLFKFQD